MKPALLVMEPPEPIPLPSLGVATAAEFLESTHDDRFWQQLVALLVPYLLPRIDGTTPVLVRDQSFRLRWLGRSRPTPLDVIDRAFESIFYDPAHKRRSRHWDPTERGHAPPEHDLPNWTAEMWSLYWFLTGRPVPVLDSILANLAGAYSNRQQALESFTAADGEHEAKELKVATAAPAAVLPKAAPLPHRKLMADEDRQRLMQSVSAIDCPERELLGAVVDHIWTWRAPLAKPKQKWKAERCAKDIADRFPDLRGEKLRLRIYALKRRYLRLVWKEYLFSGFSDMLPAHLRALARECFDNPQQSPAERTAAFARKTGLSTTAIDAMFDELSIYRGDWPRQMPSEIQAIADALFAASEA